MKQVVFSHIAPPTQDARRLSLLTAFFLGCYLALAAPLFLAFPRRPPIRQGLAPPLGLGLLFMLAVARAINLPAAYTCIRLCLIIGSLGWSSLIHDLYFLENFIR